MATLLPFHTKHTDTHKPGKIFAQNYEDIWSIAEIMHQPINISFRIFFLFHCMHSDQSGSKRKINKFCSFKQLISFSKKEEEKTKKKRWYQCKRCSLNTQSSFHWQTKKTNYDYKNYYLLYECLKKISCNEEEEEENQTPIDTTKEFLN